MEKNEIKKQEGLDELEMLRYKTADDNIKDKCKTLDWSLAAIMLIYESYKSNKISLHKPVNIEDAKLINVINETFDITNDVTDVIICKEVYEKA